ncbi:Formyltransferase [Apiospora saccharicola]|uniref:methionyl-tRNA formyltransferase n=1 Tax=Apiospora saccharicola TaxID=335842 RepID=A0ABR1U753_9PEZI
MMMRRPLVAIRGGVLSCTRKYWQSPAIATTSCQLWRNCCYPQRGFSSNFFTATRNLQQQEQRQKKQSDPLRILFCGSDEFSSASLRALHEEKERNPGLIDSIDVVVRPGKRVGRGLKQIQHPPIRQVAEEELKLPVHERDTFTGWDMPSGINLIIAVSFGKLVPNRLLQAAKYGGLNVHPSLLPNLRGPAPLHNALLNWVKVTGVTLQTLDPWEFDKGLVLAQTPPDELIEIPLKCTVPQLRDLVTPVGARMLVQGLRDGVHVPPLDAQQTGRVIGPLWFYAKQRATGAIKRVIIDQADEDEMLKIVLMGFTEDIPKSWGMEFANTVIYDPQIPPEQKRILGSSGSLLWYLFKKDDDKIYLFEGPYSKANVNTKLRCLGITHLKVDGQVAKPAAQVLEQFYGFPDLEHQISVL